jgi:hypothetical protein
MDYQRAVVDCGPTNPINSRRVDHQNSAFRLKLCQLRSDSRQQGFAFGNYGFERRVLQPHVSQFFSLHSRAQTLFFFTTTHSKTGEFLFL